MTREQAIKANPFASVLASYENAQNQRNHCVFNNIEEANNWLWFNNNYMVKGTKRIEYI